MPYETTALVRFAHVDAAGTVFYPRYFEILNGAVEDWFAHMGCDFRHMITEGQMGTPIVKLEAEFAAPSMLGDSLAIQFNVHRLGKSGCEVGYTISCNGGLRVKGVIVMVCLDAHSGKGMPWPKDLRDQMCGI